MSQLNVLVTIKSNKVEAAFHASKYATTLNASNNFISSFRATIILDDDNQNDIVVVKKLDGKIIEVKKNQISDYKFVEETGGSGGPLILVAANGGKWLVGVNDLGALTTVTTTGAGVASTTLTSPNGTVFTLGVNNAGALTTV